MARTALSAQVIPNGLATASLITVTWTAADTTNDNAVPLTGREILLAQNTDTAPHNVTVSSVADPMGRTADITDAIPAGDVRVYGGFPTTGWLQEDGNLYFQADSNTVHFAVLQTQR